MNELENAVDLVENGWCAGALIDDGKVCAAGAIYAAHKGYSAGMLAQMSMDQQNDLKTQAGDYVNTSESGRALADEIVERGLCKTKDAKGAYSIVWAFNDSFPRPQGDFENDEAYEAAELASMAAHKYEVLEVMKHAAKRLDTPKD